MKAKLLFLSISLIIMAFSLSAQNVKNFLGEYGMQADCVIEFPDDRPPEEQPPVFYKINIEEDTETALGIQFLFAQQGINGHYVKATVSSDSEFDAPLQEFPAFVPTFFEGEGNIKGDSIFMQYDITISTYYVLRCDCKGKKNPLGGSIPSLSSGKNRIYVDATRQVIVIDETLQNQSLIVELINLQGNIIWKKTNAGESISIANLPSGIYLCRILQDGKIIYSDKILKR